MQPRFRLLLSIFRSWIRSDPASEEASFLIRIYMKSRRAVGGGLVRSDAARVEHLIDLIRFRHQLCGEVFLDIKGVPWVRVRQILIIGVLGDVVLIREEGAHAPKLQDALAAVQHRQLIYRGKVFATMSSDEFKDASLFHKKGRKCRTGFFHPHVILPPPPKVAQGVVTMQVPALWC